MQFDQLFDFVAQKQEAHIPGPQLPPQALERNKQIASLHILELDSDPFQPFIGVQERVGKIEMELFGLVGTLEVPEYRHVAAIPGCLGNEFDLLQERGLADPASAEQPDAVPGPVEDFSNLGRTAVKMVAPHPLPDDERYDGGRGVTDRP